MLNNSEKENQQGKKRQKKTGEFSTTAAVSEKLNNQNQELHVETVTIKPEKIEESVQILEDTRTHVLINLIKKIVELKGNFNYEDEQFEQLYKDINYYLDLDQKDLNIDWNQPTNTTHYLSTIDDKHEFILINPSLLQLFIASTGFYKNNNIILNKSLYKCMERKITNVLAKIIKEDTKLDVKVTVAINKKEYSLSLQELAYLVNNKVAGNFLQSKNIIGNPTIILRLSLIVYGNLKSAASCVNKHEAKVDMQIYELATEVYKKFLKETKDKLALEQMLNYYNSIAAGYARSAYKEIPFLEKELAETRTENLKLIEELQQLKSEKKNDQEIARLSLS